jgi:hypothetical protein
MMHEEQKKHRRHDVISLANTDRIVDDGSLQEFPAR